MHRFLMWVIVLSCLGTLALSVAIYRKGWPQHYRTPCDVDAVRAALAVMGPLDTVQHEPCASDEMEADIEALYEQDMRQRDGLPAPWEPTFNYDKERK